MKIIQIKIERQKIPKNEKEVIIMAKNKIYMITVVFAIAVTVMSSIQAFSVPFNNVGQGSPSENAVTEEESLDIAREFVLNSPTYRFDGENLVHVETLALRCPSCWQVVFKFTCRHAGYGDRSKLKVLQVITEHTAVITVVEGEVTEAVLDGTWDMVNQEVIQGQDITEETEDLYMWKKSSAAYNFAVK
jgi:hypothetical protein